MECGGWRNAKRYDGNSVKCEVSKQELDLTNVQKSFKIVAASHEETVERITINISLCTHLTGDIVPVTCC